MQPNERRRRIIEILNLRRQDTMQNLANEFGVSRLTIYRDLLVLEESYPLRHIHGRAVLPCRKVLLKHATFDAYSSRSNSAKS